MDTYYINLEEAEAQQHKLKASLSYVDPMQSLNNSQEDWIRVFVFIFFKKSNMIDHNTTYFFLYNCVKKEDIKVWYKCTYMAFKRRYINNISTSLISQRIQWNVFNKAVDKNDESSYKK